MAMSVLRAYATAAATPSTSSFPSAPSIGTSFAPPLKNVAAPSSSRSMCAWAWQNTAPHGAVSAAIASAFPAMPLRIGKTSTSVSKISQHCRRTRAVISSPPYDVVEPAFARTTASRISGAPASVLSDRKSLVTPRSYH